MNETFIIAEAGVNHNGCLTRAKEMIDVAIACGANAVKFQSFCADQLLTQIAPKADYQLKNTASSESQYEMIKRLELSMNDHAELINHCAGKNIQFLSTPFDHNSVDLLANHFSLPLLKIASGEITNSPLLLHIARTGKPVILSTGMATLGDIENALSILAFGYLTESPTLPTREQLVDVYRTRAAEQVLQKNVSLLHCTTEYPCPYSEVNLRALTTLRQAFALPVGYSDHTNGIEIAVAAVACGATIIEKHFTLDKTLPGPDHRASLEPNELKSMIDAIRHVELAIGHGRKIPSSAEFNNRSIARKSLIARCDITIGEMFTEANLGLKRPGTGIPGIYYWDWLGRVAQQNYRENDLIEAL